MDKIQKIVEKLEERYTTDFFAEHHDRDPYKVLVSCLISLRTKDEVTYPAADRLYKLADNPDDMIKLSEKQIQDAIYPAGFYRVKAKRIKNISKKLVEEYGSKVPDHRKELLKFKGIGRKTANIVLVFGFDKPAIPVDIHVHRISNRIGWVDTQKPEETEKELVENIPRKHWKKLNELLVRHGQNICKPRKPLCYKCPIVDYCSFEEKNLEK